MYSPADPAPAHHSVHLLPHKTGPFREQLIVAKGGRCARLYRQQAASRNGPLRVNIAVGETREIAVDLSAMPTSR